MLDNRSDQNIGPELKCKREYPHVFPPSAPQSSQETTTDFVDYNAISKDETDKANENINNGKSSQDTRSWRGNGHWDRMT